MNLHTSSRGQHGKFGYLLVEYLIYIAVLAVVVGIAMSAFYRCLDNSCDLARTSDEILRVLRVGESWRGDIREAAGSPRVIHDGPLTAFEIPKAKTLVVYGFGDGAVWRKEGQADPKQILPRVASCRMLEDRDERVTSWRWEVELTSKKKHVRLHPLFTFEAVPKAVAGP